MDIKSQLKSLFQELNASIEEINRERHEKKLSAVSKSKVRLLGQISLLSNEKASAILTLAQTGDMDAYLIMDHIVKEELKKVLKKYRLIYDEDSYLIWIPEDAKFNRIFDFNQIVIESIDPESALVSKAVKAPEKNKQLIREAIASSEFPNLVDRILKNGGKLENFI